MQARVHVSSLRRLACTQPTRRRGADLRRTGPSSDRGAASYGGCGCAPSSAGRRAMAPARRAAESTVRRGEPRGCALLSRLTARLDRASAQVINVDFLAPAAAPRYHLKSAELICSRLGFSELSQIVPNSSQDLAT